jgi:hypothetical protein
VCGEINFIAYNGTQLGLVPIEVNKLVTKKLDYQIIKNINGKAENKALSQVDVISRRTEYYYEKLI